MGYVYSHSPGKKQKSNRNMSRFKVQVQTQYSQNEEEVETVEDCCSEMKVPMRKSLLYIKVLAFSCMSFSSFKYLHHFISFGFCSCSFKLGICFS